MVWKERKAFVSDLKEIYGATNVEMAADALSRFEQHNSHLYKIIYTLLDRAHVPIDYSLAIGT